MVRHSKLFFLLLSQEMWKKNLIITLYSIRLSLTKLCARVCVFVCACFWVEVHRVWGHSRTGQEGHAEPCGQNGVAFTATRTQNQELRRPE